MGAPESNTRLLQSNYPKLHVPHLLVVDAVEGLETMAGNVDAFGLRRSRRSRLAQLVRIARKAHCNLIFVIEQKSPDVKLDEVFISDLVLRLNVAEKDGYLQKSIEVEKARSVSHVRGIHELQIRDGRGGQGDGVVPDDPRIAFDSHKSANLSKQTQVGEDDEGQFLGYMQVWPSLHQKTKNERETTRSRSTKSKRSFASNWFGNDLALIDKMISKSRGSRSEEFQDTVVVSVGEAGTHKSKLAYAFLAEPFRNGNRDKSCAILITSEGATSSQMKSVFAHWKAVPKEFDVQVLVRPVQPRFLSSSAFLNRIKLCIRHMKRRLKESRLNSFRLIFG